MVGVRFFCPAALPELRLFIVTNDMPVVTALVRI
jgi:hypothetical protein